MEFSEGMGSNCIKAWFFFLRGGGGVISNYCLNWYYNWDNHIIISIWFLYLHRHQNNNCHNHYHHQHTNQHHHHCLHHHNQQLYYSQLSLIATTSCMQPPPVSDHRSEQFCFSFKYCFKNSLVSCQSQKFLTTTTTF